MKQTQKIISALLVCIIISSCSYDEGSDTYIEEGADTYLFVSKKDKFSVQYPKAWNRAGTVHKQTVFRVESPGGDDFNVVVVLSNKIFNNMSPNEYSKYMYDNSDGIIKHMLAPSFPDAKLINKGITTLSQQSAMFYEADFTLSAAGTQIPYRVYAITSKYENKLYTLTFRTPQQFFHEYRPIISSIALSFQLIKKSVK